MSLDELYQDLLLDHSKHPRGKGTLNPADATCALNNPLCGDKVDLSIRNEDGIIRCQFEGAGCSISQASASLLTEICNGKSPAEVAHLSDLFHRMMKSDLTEQEYTELKDGAALAGVRKFSTRIRCALLAWEALDRCLKQLPVK